MDALWDDSDALLGVGATALFQDLLAADRVPSDPVARAAYDRRPAGHGRVMNS
jgi:hypothetical protein